MSTSAKRIRPSRPAPQRWRTTIACRFEVACMSSSRGSSSCTGRPVTQAASAAQAAGSVG
ncbi:MAG: hypothetical protein M5U13_17660 [Thermoanaerobaculia bacterium]|nr:hypothetical protein [Thermoanaerobaculia bacterium]